MKKRILSLAAVLTVALTLPAHSSEVILRVQQPGVPEWTFPISISADGNKILFSSDDAVLPGGGGRHLYLHDRATQITTLIDVDKNGGPGSVFNPARAKMSDNGRFVVFVSYEADLVEGDTNQDYDLFLRDVVAGTTTRVSLDADGNEVFTTNNFSDPISYIGADVSDDGKKIVFAATADQFFPSGENNYSGIFLRDLDADTLTLISVGATADYEPNEKCEDPVISANGKKIAFTSIASNLVVNDNNAQQDIFLKDLDTGTLSLISRSDGGIAANGGSSTPSMTADGTKIAFLSVASNLIDTETIASLGLYLHDTASGISLGSRHSSGDPVKGVTNGSLSSNGRYLTILSTAANVIPGDLRDRFSPADPLSAFVYLLDRNTGLIGRSLRTESGDEPEVGIWTNAYAADDGSVVYGTKSAEIVTPDNIGTLDLFLTPVTELVFENTAGAARRDAAAVKALLTAKYQAQATKLKKQIKAAKKKKSSAKAKKLLKKLKLLKAKLRAL